MSIIDHARRATRLFVSVAATATLATAFLPVRAAMAQMPPSSTAVRGAAAANDAWPRSFPSPEGTILFYQPQLDEWDGAKFDAHAAVAIEKKDTSKPPVYGVIWVSSRTEVDKDTRKVTFLEMTIQKANFPSEPENADRYMSEMQKIVLNRTRTISLDRLEAAMAEKAARGATSGKALKNEPPKIIFVEVPTLHVPIDGTPVFKPTGVGGFERVLNTKQLIVSETASKQMYLRIYDGWMTAPSLEGPWTVAANPPKGLGDAMNEVLKKYQVDLLEGTNPEDAGEGKAVKPPSLEKGPVPAIHVSTSATEIIVSEGPANFVPVDGTQLLYVSNTTSNVFKALADQNLYVLLSGRWFRAAGTGGPWTHVPGGQLPADFKAIPDNSPKENVKASIPGTPQAKEALIANAIPQTATVRRDQTHIDSVVYDGEPRFEPIEGTALFYAVNCNTPVIKIDNVSYYAVKDAVWFTAAHATGPWSVASAVPAVMYTIPPSSPLYYVTFVKVYNSTYDDVQVGYTPGYYGSVAEDEDEDGEADYVVYGTGYDYDPWISDYWWGYPYAWGWGYGLAWTPWCGWAWGYGGYWGWNSIGGIGWGWGTGPWGGAVAWGPRGFIGTTGNVFNRWGANSVVSRHGAGYNRMNGNYYTRDLGAAYNSRTGTLAAGRKATVGNVFSGNSVTAGKGIVYNPNTGNATRVGGIRGENAGAVKLGDNVFAGKDGNVYRKGEDGWSQVGRDEPKARDRADRADTMREERQRPDRETMERLDREQKNRDFGDKRSRDFSSYDRSRSIDRGRAPNPSFNRGSYGGGGMRGGGMRGGGMRGGGRRR